ncbi:hypothetical protein GW17_00056519, partial [Ensete ventricosum]
DGYPCERHRSRKQLALVGWPLAVAPCERLVASRPYGLKLLQSDLATLAQREGGEYEGEVKAAAYQP